MVLAVGTKLGPYEIVAPIGAGGMGEVYKARDTRLDRPVAIKVSKEKFSERFEREARSIAALNHPNICHLYDVGPDYLVMEYVEGQALKGPLSLDQAMKYAMQICDALDAAHKRGITHRDLKPANILVNKAGVKLLDFGLARIEVGAGDDTVTMAVMGTPAYMAPEQWEGKPGDARSDIYALGCLLYEMLTGKRSAQDRAAIEPAAVEQIIKRCLEQDPDERWQSARDLRHALELPIANATAAGNPWRERVAWIALAAVVAALLLFSWPRHTPASTLGEVVKLAIYPPESGTFSRDPSNTVNIPEFALSRDGRAIVMVAAAPGGKSMLWLRAMDEVAARPLGGTEGAYFPFWSPDSRWIGFFAEGKLKKIPAVGGSPQLLSDGFSDRRGGSWGPDGTIVASTGSVIMRVSSGGGTASAVTKLDAPRGEGGYYYPQFLPDGSHFLFYLTAGNDQRGVYAGSLDGRTRKGLLLPSDAQAVYSPPGYLLFREGASLVGRAFDAGRLELSGDQFQVAEGVGRTTGWGLAVSVSDTGALAYANVLSESDRLVWFDRSGRQLGSIGPVGDYTDFRLSPDERQLALTVVDVKGGNPGVWLADLARGSLSPFARGPALDAEALWSPDGSSIIYRTSRSGTSELFKRSAGGGGAEEVLLPRTVQISAGITSTLGVPTDVSRDGKHLLFTVPSGTSNWNVWLLPLAGDRKPLRFLDSPADERRHPNFSPDGRLVAFDSNESGKFEVNVVTFPAKERKWQVSTNGGYEPRWRADGRELYFLSEDRRLMAVSVEDGPTFGVPKPLFQTGVPEGNSAIRTHYVPSRDGQRFLVNTQTGDPSPNAITVVLNWTAGLKK